jgi:hypothetical protein
MDDPIDILPRTANRNSRFEIRKFPTALLALIAALVSVVAWHEHRELEAQSLALRKTAFLVSENDRLSEALAASERKATNAQDVLRRSQIERDVASIRQLSFSQPVVYESLDRAGIRQVVAGKLSEQYTDKDVQDMSDGYSAFGLLPVNFPLKDTYINLLGEQIAAFYDQHQHKLFMFQDASLENGQNRVILAHELTHALQDQNFGLLKLPLEARNNDDRAAAATALIEGDATLVMSEFMARDMTWKSFADTVGFSVNQSMVQIRKAPHYLREMLVFPYIKGQQFCAAVYARGGYPALSAVYADPPSSTAQILHPEKYFAESREAPIEIKIPDTTFKGAKPLADNVLGEMGCRLLFAQADPDTAEKVAAGWRGDRYLVYDGGKELVWNTVWSSPEAAHAALMAFQAACEKRFKIARTIAGGAFSVWTEPNKSDASSGRYLTIMQFDRNGVVFILAPDEKSSNLLNEKFAGLPHG